MPKGTVHLIKKTKYYSIAICPSIELLGYRGLLIGVVWSVSQI